MIDNEKRIEKEEEKSRIRKKYQVKINPENYEYYPAKKQYDYYDNDIDQRVAVYVRVSTDSVRQTSSYELQRKYYEDFVIRHPNWTLVKIYADEGISGTSLAHRDAFNEMIRDCRSGKIDMIITKSVSRFSRNIMDCIGVTRNLAEMQPPVGIFFETEGIFSLKEDSQMALSFQATIAEEESHAKSRSMEASLRMRLDNGIPLTPKLLGYTHDQDGNLIINPEEAKTVKLIFCMYLYGCSTNEIAKTLNALERKSYLGNVNWSSSAVIQILRNERHCGEVLTRKTFMPNFRTHLSRKNRGERPQSRYLDHHEAIVSRDDFIAVQRLLDNAKYGQKSFLPELRVIDKGILRGFVSIHTKWSGFKAEDYMRAAQSVYDPSEINKDEASASVQIEVNAGDFDMRGFEVTRLEFINTNNKPTITVFDNRIQFNKACIEKFGDKNDFEMLINPIEEKLALRPAAEGLRNSVQIAARSEGKVVPRSVYTTAFSDTIHELLCWNKGFRRRITGTVYEQDNEVVIIFSASDAVAYLASEGIGEEQSEKGELLSKAGKYIKGVPKDWTASFGKQYYLRDETLAALDKQSETDWKLRLEGKLFETGSRIKVTDFETIRSYIRAELGDVIQELDQ